MCIDGVPSYFGVDRVFRLVKNFAKRYDIGLK
jgi:hypothetical protein